jgi:NAD(P)-dependent dehydrogenase (short-subunit alcohol dehydrogenase family)
MSAAAAEGRPLAGRHAIVTGASRGIGLAIAAELARRGASVTLMARTLDALRERATELARAHGVATGAVACDVADAGSVRAAFAQAIEEGGAPWALVNNAGAADGAPFGELTRETWDRMLLVNLTGTYACTAEALPHMLAAGGGRIVNVASTAGLRGYKTMTAYCAAKHGVVGLTRALALETARRGVTVNAVCPGYAETDMAEQAVANLVAARGVTPDEGRAMLLRTIPRGRLTAPAEIADAVAWLCGPAAAAVTGVALPVAGGEVA